MHLNALLSSKPAQKTFINPYQPYKTARLSNSINQNHLLAITVFRGLQFVVEYTG